jgi:hypothetical protein
MELLTQHVEDVIVSIELDDQAVTATLQACVRCGHRAFRIPRSHSRHTPQADPQDLSALFIHEARMALLTRIAQSPEGAFALLHCSMCHCPALLECELLLSAAVASRRHCFAAGQLPVPLRVAARDRRARQLGRHVLDRPRPLPAPACVLAAFGRGHRRNVARADTERHVPGTGDKPLQQGAVAASESDRRLLPLQIVDFVLNRLPIINRVLDDAVRSIPPSTATADAGTITQLLLTEADLEPLRHAMRRSSYGYSAKLGSDEPTILVFHRLLTSIFFHLRPHEDNMRDRLANFATRLHTKQGLLLKKVFPPLRLPVRYAVGPHAPTACLPSFHPVL